MEKKHPWKWIKKNLDWGLVYWPSHFSRGVSFLKFYIFWIRLCIFFSFIAIFHAFFHAVFSVNAGNRTHICQEYAGKWQGRHIFPHFRAKNMIFQWFNLFFTRGKMINFIWIYLYTFYWEKIDILQIISYFLWDYGLGTYYRCRIYTNQTSWGKRYDFPIVKSYYFPWGEIVFKTIYLFCAWEKFELPVKNRF